MGIQFKGSSVSAGAPDIEAGVFDARFDGVEAKTLDKSKFDPNVFIWHFTLFQDGAVIYDDGDPIEVDGLTSQSMNTKSKTTPRAVKYLKGLLTPGEFAQFEAAADDAEADGLDAEALEGRMVQVVVSIKDSGWPQVDDVLPAKKVRKAA